MIALVDYGAGNLTSVRKALSAVGASFQTPSAPGELTGAAGIIVPGVGHFGATARLDEAWRAAILERVERGVPLLGVCVGMQMLFEESEEFGVTAGLGFLRGRVRRFDEGQRVPQVGWNQVEWAKRHALAEGIESGEFFYFVHSYFCEAGDDAVVVGETEYGERYASVVARDNVCGVQFHPEKSQAAGLRLLKNFAELR